MKRLALLCLPLLCPATAAATEASWWPPAIRGEHGVFEIIGNLGYDMAWIDADDGSGHGHRHTDGWRRQEIGFSYTRPGRLELFAGYDPHQKGWADAGIRLDSRWLGGRDLGKLRIGQSRMPVGLEGSTASRAGVFIENSLPTQAMHQSRRLGVDWAHDSRYVVVNLGRYLRSDLGGNFKGHTRAGRLAWTPRKAAGDVLHLGLAASRERLHSETNGWGIEIPPATRLRARSATVLAVLPVLDSGPLLGLHHIDRQAAEAVWIAGPFSLQGEYLRHRSRLASQPQHYRADGGYLLATWSLTGAPRSYFAGTTGNPASAPRTGTIELAARYDRLHLDDGNGSQGHARQWALGANWYLGRHLKLQANYATARARQGSQPTRHDTVALRTQLHF